MMRRRRTPERIVRKLREAERLLGRAGRSEAAKAIGISEQAFQRRRAHAAFHADRTLPTENAEEPPEGPRLWPGSSERNRARRSACASAGNRPNHPFIRSRTTASSGRLTRSRKPKMPSVRLPRRKSVRALS